MVVAGWVVAEAVVVVVSAVEGYNIASKRARGKVPPGSAALKDARIYA